MQTFLPYPDFSRSASVLDRLRLGKQRVEAYQILRTLTGESSGWKNHPAVKMWKGYEIALAFYGIAVCEEWITRGYKDSLYYKFWAYIDNKNARYNSILYPFWLGNHAFHLSHRRALKAKSPSHYSRYFKCRPEIKYVWPV